MSQEQEPYESQRFGTIRIALMAASISLTALAVTTHQGEAKSPESVQEQPVLPTAGGEQEVPAGIKPFAEFREQIAMPDNILHALNEATVKVSTESGGCTGTIVNNYLLTAAHCRPDLENDDYYISLSRWQDNFDETAGTLQNWSYDDDRDILMGRLDSLDESVDTWWIGSFKNEDPLPGTQFVMASLPGESETPIAVTLTFLGRNPDAQAKSGLWVFAVNPENTPELATKACMPGASGSLLTDWRGGVAVLSTSDGATTHKGKPNEHWIDTRNYYQNTLKVDLQTVSYICLGSPFTRDTINTYIASVEK